MNTVPSPVFAALSAPLLLVFVLAAAILGLWIRARLERRPLRRIAEQFGYVYHTRRSDQAFERFAGLDVFRHGHAQRITDLMTTDMEQGPLTCFRLITELGSRTSRVVLQHFVVIIETGTGLRTTLLGRGTSDGPQAKNASTEGAVGRGARSLRGAASLEPRDRSGKPKDAAPFEHPDRLTTWLANQDDELVWQIEHDCVAGYRPYRSDGDRAEELLRLTVELAEILHDDSSDSDNRTLRAR